MEAYIANVIRESDKVYIPKVRKVTWDSGEMCEFASSLISALFCLGEDIPYPYVMGASGAAFRFTITPGEWDFGSYSIRNISTDPYEPIRRAFTAAGYAYSLCEPASFQEDAAKIMDSLNRGVPVLAWPVVGPSDCCIITGYDHGGEVLLGWSTYQDIPDDHNIPHDNTGYFRKPGWHDNTKGYILIGAKVDRPPLRAVYLDALKWAVYLMRLTGMGGKVTGLEGLQAWSEDLDRVPRIFPEQEEAFYTMLYLSTAINMTMLRDHCLAEPFLHQIVKDIPDFRPELDQAINSYIEMRRLRDSMDNLIADNFSPQSTQAIKVPKIRRSYAETILLIREVEEEAITEIESLIERCG